MFELAEWLYDYLRVLAWMVDIDLVSVSNAGTH